MCTRPIEFEGIACSNECLAFRHASFQGCIVGVMKFNSARMNPPVFKLKGHKSAVQDIQFNPHNQKIMATCGDDFRILIWDLNNISDKTQPVTSFYEHSKRCSSICWNPSVNNILASIGNDQKIICWDVEKSKYLFQANSNTNPSGCKWNINGSFLAYVDGDAMLNIIDIRLNKIIYNFKCHDEPKKTKIVWIDGLCGSDYHIISTGFAKGHFRQIKLWDLRSTKSPVNVNEIESSPSALYPIYDEGLGIIVLLGKGESIFRFLSYNSGCIRQIPGARSNVSHACFGLAPKSLCTTANCEVLKFFKMQSLNVYTSSVIVPRRNKDIFCAELYPDIISEPTYSVQEWLDSKEKPLVRKPFVPFDPHSSTFSNDDPKNNAFHMESSTTSTTQNKKENTFTKELSKKSPLRTIACESRLFSLKSMSEKSYTNEDDIENNNISGAQKTSHSTENREKSRNKDSMGSTGKAQKDKSSSSVSGNLHDISNRLMKVEEENKKLKKYIVDLQNRMNSIEFISKFNANSIANQYTMDEMKNEMYSDKNNADFFANQISMRSTKYINLNLNTSESNVSMKANTIKNKDSDNLKTKKSETKSKSKLQKTTSEKNTLTKILINEKSRKSQ